MAVVARRSFGEVLSSLRSTLPRGRRRGGPHAGGAAQGPGCRRFHIV